VTWNYLSWRLWQGILSMLWCHSGETLISSLWKRSHFDRRIEKESAMSFKAFSRRKFVGSAVALAPAVLVSFADRAEADTLPAPKDRPILTVSGKIRNYNAGETAVLDRAMLESLGTQTIDTHTPWYDQAAKFEGPLMTRILDYVGAYGDRVMALALNDYATEIPISDFSRFGTILAMKRDNVYLNVREKGPLFVVYPYDSDSELKQQKYYGRSAWQVAQLIVK
jgi:hypothetical protein